jgi:hypothetical protein
MLKFTLFNGKVVIDPSLVMIQEFTDILDYGKVKSNDDLSNRLLLYVFYCCDLTEQNPLRDVDYRLKESQALTRAFPGVKQKEFTKKEDTLISAAIDAYNFLNETSLERATLSYDQKIDEVRTLLDSIKPEVHSLYELHLCDECQSNGNDVLNEVREVKEYISNNKIIADLSKQLGDMAIYKLRAMETAKKIENTGRVRGGKGSSLIERGGFRRDGEK